jgi:hypothetical protein
VTNRRTGKNSCRQPAKVIDANHKHVEKMIASVLAADAELIRRG